jgi:hypothetical protein
VRRILQILALFAIVVVASCGGCYVLFPYGPYISKGECADHECLANSQQLTVFADMLPPSARNIAYAVDWRDQYFEARFTCSFEEFVTWAESVGWQSHEIDGNRVGPLVTLFYHKSPPANPPDGYYLRTIARREVGDAWRDARVIAYDIPDRIAYFQLWGTEFEKTEISNEVLLQQRR